ncbi:MAG: hypothetical protein Q9192_003403 [Flavoplaca navasiana]
MLCEAAAPLNVSIVVLDAEDAPAKQIKQVKHDRRHHHGSFKDPFKVYQLAVDCDILTVEIEHVDTLILEEIGRFGVRIPALDATWTTKQVAIHPSWETLRLIQDKYERKQRLSEWGTEERDGNALRVVPYPVVETIHEESICSKVFMPPRSVSEPVCKQAQQLACETVRQLSGKGVFAVEMFLTDDGDLLVNEIAPRVHNSGHMTIETVPHRSQFKAHLTSILGRAIPEKLEPSVTSSTMINILGGTHARSHERLIDKADSMYDKDMEIHLHLYGKQSKPGRKIGHITITSSADIEQLEKLVQPLVDVADEIRQERIQAAGSNQDPTGVPDNKPLILVTMVSDSDLPVLMPGIDILYEFDVPYEVDITSAHRTPGKMGEVAAMAAFRGIKVIIAAAGGAAHLPGMIASHTALPVIGVPVKASHLDGQDSLLSIVQMPKGVPVATVGINNSVNAALLAIRILGTFDVAYQEKMRDYQAGMKKEVDRKSKELKERGVENYLAGMSVK